MSCSEPPRSPDRPARPLPRRALLAVSGTAVLAAAGACSSAGAPTGTTSSAAGTTPSSPSAPASSTSAPATTSAAASPTVTAASPAQTPAATSTAEPADPAPTGPVLASVADVEAAGAVVVGDGANPYLLAYAGGTVVAHTAICTHQQCAIAASGMCPCHGSRFDVQTGAVVNGPAQRPLDELPVTVSGGQVYAG